MTVARKGVLLGVLNRWSLLALGRRLSGAKLWRQARFFSPGELRRLSRRAAASRFQRLETHTVLMPLGLEFAAGCLPFGAFIGARLELAAPEFAKEAEP